MTEKAQLADLKSMVERLSENAKLVKFGEVILSLRIHDSWIVAVTNTVTQNIIDKRR